MKATQQDDVARSLLQELNHRITALEIRIQLLEARPPRPKQKLDIEEIMAGMRRLSLNQTMLANRLETSKVSVSQWMHGTCIPRPAMTKELAAKLGIPIEKLFLKETI